MVRSTQPDGPTCVYKGEKPTFEDSKFIPVPVKKGNWICHCWWYKHSEPPGAALDIWKRKLLFPLVKSWVCKSNFNLPKTVSGKLVLQVVASSEFVIDNSTFNFNASQIQPKVVKLSLVQLLFYCRLSILFVWSQYRNFSPFITIQYLLLNCLTCLT